jgi:alpha-1,2-mannosyltransferase
VTATPGPVERSAPPRRETRDFVSSAPNDRAVAALVRRFRSPLQVFAFLEVPIAFAVALGWHVYGHGGGYDFAIFRRAGQAVLHGHTPFVQPTFELLAANNRWVYPTPFAIPFIPFALLPEELAAVFFLVLSLAAIVASLWLLGVRDWRCYGLSLLGVPVFGALSLEALGPFLLLLCAVGWRFRDRTVAGVPLALAAAAKLFLWPVLLWLLITRRFRAFAAAVATIAATVAVWAIVDPGGMSRYPETVHLLNAVQRWKSYSVQSLFISLHFSVRTSEVVGGLAAIAAVGAVVLLRRRGDAATFAAAVAASLIATPILWMHYLVLLLVPIAIARPRLAPLWLLPLALWATPHPHSLGVVWKIVFTLCVIGLAAVWAVAWPVRWKASGKPAPTPAGSMAAATRSAV